MKKILKIFAVIAIFIAVLSLALIVGLKTYVAYMFHKTDNEQNHYKTEESKLTKEEKKLVGIWESEDGWILAVRPRNHRVESKDTKEMENIDFKESTTKQSDNLDSWDMQELDSIIYDARAKAWFKMTRDTSTATKKDGQFTIEDTHQCPVSDEQNARYVDSVQRLTYDAKTDTVSYLEKFDTENVTEKEFHRTNKKIETADWAWYYKIHPDREAHK